MKGWQQAAENPPQGVRQLSELSVPCVVTSEYDRESEQLCFGLGCPRSAGVVIQGSHSLIRAKLALREIDE